MCQAVVPASAQEIPVQVSLAPEQRKGNKAIVIAKINLLSLSSHDNLVYSNLFNVSDEPTGKGVY